MGEGGENVLEEENGNTNERKKGVVKGQGIGE